MNRKIGLFLVTLSTLGVWLVATSGCSGGGDTSASVDAGDPSRADVDVPDDPEADGQTATADTMSPALDDDTAPASPFDAATPDATTDLPAPSDAAPTADDELPPSAPSATDDGPALQRPIGSGNDTSAIAGLWDYTRDTGRGTDIVLFAIDDAGGLIEYDFQNDAVGSGADCHLVRTFAIASSGNERYDIQDASALPGAGSIDDVLITADEATITFRYLGVASDPQFGGSQGGVSETWPAAAGDVEQLVVCDS